MEVKFMDDNKVNVKLEKHIWPDELETRKKKRSFGLLIVFLCLLSFLVGGVLARLYQPQVVNTPNVEPTINQPQISTPLTEAQQFEKFEYIFNVLKENWYFSKEMKDPSNQIMDNAIIGMLEENGDIHTSYMTAEELQAFEDGINQNYVGIGVQYYQVDGVSIVLKVFNDSPAEKAGVLPGDIFKTVDGTDVTNMDQNLVSDMVRGEAGTPVVIEFQRGEEIIELNIIRGAITSTTFAEMLENNIGYLEINSFGTSTGNEIKKELDMLTNKGATKLIIDVRDNGGGYLNALNQIASFFLDSNQVVIAQEDVDGNINKTYSTGQKYENFQEIVMLINQNTASAAEVLALALRDNLDIELIGTTTYGKGTVQTSIPLADGSSLKYTIAQWISPSGQRINGVGVKPSIEVKIHEVFYISTPLLNDEVIKPDTVHNGLVFVQQALDFLGYKPGRVDGYYSNDTLKAYQAYLEDFDLKKTDEITQETITQLSSRVYAVYNQNLKDHDIQLEKAIEVLQ